MTSSDRTEICRRTKG